MKNRLNAILVLISASMLIALLLGFVFKVLTAAFLALICTFAVMTLSVILYVWYRVEKEPPL